LVERKGRDLDLVGRGGESEKELKKEVREMS